MSLTIVLREFLRKAWDAPDLRIEIVFVFEVAAITDAQTVLRVRTVRADVEPPEMPVDPSGHTRRSVRKPLVLAMTHRRLRR